MNAVLFNGYYVKDAYFGYLVYEFELGFSSALLLWKAAGNH